MPGVVSRGVKRKRAGKVVSKSKRPKFAQLRPFRALSYKRMYPLNRSFRTTLRYAQRGVTINPPAGGLATAFIMSANGLYDPDISGVGHQPIGFDQFMAIYDHYTVHAAKITVDFHNDDETNPVCVGIAVRDNATITTNPHEIVENGNIDYTLLNAYGKWKDMCRVTMYQDIAKFLGRKQLLSDPQCKGDASSNPTEQVYFHVVIWSLGAVDAGNTTCMVTVDYDATFHERLVTSSS